MPYDAGKDNLAKFKEKNKDFKEAPRTESVTVAQGRTVVSDHKEYGPGSMIRLSGDEAARLRKLGHIVSQDGSRATGTGSGPALSKDGEIKA